MTDITIDPEFRDWIVPLKPDEYEKLEKAILEDGCTNPLVIWNNILIDGHHRYKICTAHNIPFTTVEKDLEDRDSVKLWMVANQLARRNLESIQRIALVMKGEDLIAQRARENLITREPEYIRVVEPLVNLPNPPESINTQPPTPTEPLQRIAASMQGEDLIAQRAAENQRPVHTQVAPKVIIPIHTRDEAAKMADVSSKQYDKGKVVLQRAAPEVVAKVMAGDVSIHKAYTDIRREEKKAERQQDMIGNPPLPNGLYNVILADPPWRYEHSQTHSRDIENQYPTMALDDISSLRLPIEDNAVLFLWCPAPKLEEGLEVLNEWGFSYRTGAIWDKEHMGMGYWFRGQHEHLLVGVKGDFRPPEDDTRVSSVIHSPRSVHSAKPQIVYEMLENMFPGKKYLEAFARSNRAGWVSWGNEL